MHGKSLKLIDSGSYYYLTSAHNMNLSTYIPRPSSVIFDTKTVHGCQCHSFCSLSLHSQFSTQCDLLQALSSSSILSFP